MQTSSPIFSSRMFLPYLVMAECAYWHRLSSLDCISENKKSETSTHQCFSFFFLIAAFLIFSYSAFGLSYAKKQFYCPKKWLLMKDFLNYESIIITVESLCYSFTFKILVESRDEMFFDEKWRMVNKQKHQGFKDNLRIYFFDTNSFLSQSYIN